MANTIRELYRKPGSRPAGSWFVSTQKLSAWHIGFLINDLITVADGLDQDDEKAYHESWDRLKEVAYRVDGEGYNWNLLETDEVLYEAREDFDRFGEESPL